MADHGAITGDLGAMFDVLGAIKAKGDLGARIGPSWGYRGLPWGHLGAILSLLFSSGKWSGIAPLHVFEDVSSEPPNFEHWSGIAPFHV